MERWRRAPALGGGAGWGGGPIGLAMAVMIRQLWPALKREAERVFGNAEKVRLGAKHVVLRARRR